MEKKGAAILPLARGKARLGFVNLGRLTASLVPSFTHLHCHTQYSLLDGAAKVDPLLRKARELGMKALSITDHGNLFGIPAFVAAAQKHGVKPILGCEFYLADQMSDRSEKRRYHQVLLAKNKKGYENLVRLSSLSYMHGFYYKPRIDFDCLAEHREGLMATTCCLSGGVPRKIQEGELDQAERLFCQWLELFGDDYYVELQRHGLAEQQLCNEVLLRFAAKYKVRVVATNDVHYICREDSLAQDILLCLQTGKDYDDPNRLRFAGDDFYLKSPEEMAQLFHDIPAAVENTQEVADKVEAFSLYRDVMMPLYQRPAGFASDDAYLEHLTFERGRKRYGQLSAEVEERLRHELAIITRTGFSSYFLVVQDIIHLAKRMGVVVGPGRGSVAGSAVAYALGITDVEPLRYQLIFERFLNPDRVSMPDIDMDFDDAGRAALLHKVAERYGRGSTEAGGDALSGPAEKGRYQPSLVGCGAPSKKGSFSASLELPPPPPRVAQIVTLSSMGAKSTIRDVARVMKLPLAEADVLAKMVPERPGVTLGQAFTESRELAAIREANSLAARVLAMSEQLEGSVRHTGIHAAGVIIAPDDLINFLPVMVDKESNMLVTQYEGTVVESVGMLKMDFLGLKTLSIIKDACILVMRNHAEKLEMSELPLDDEKTFALYQRGDTVATFQFESDGMRQWLIQLQPSCMEDLIAMNALYRPGPMQFIPNFVARKHGREEVAYPHPLLENILRPTYGIMVYQEQIMQTAQILAGYSLAEADLLRRAMGKKKAEEMARHRVTFAEGAARKHQISEKQALQVFDIMERFSQYGFPRSHSTAYSLLAYQTAYLKAHYPAEYMAAVLSHNQNDMGKISMLIGECKRMGITVDGPDLNESDICFDSKRREQIRFGLSAIKGLGAGAFEGLIAEREANGPFRTIHELNERVPAGSLSRKVIESMALAGALDNLPGPHRRQYVEPTEGGKSSFADQLIKYAQRIAKVEQANQPTLFLMEAEHRYGKRPEPPACLPFSMAEKLRHEKELVGFYISGHPLDSYRQELLTFCTADTQRVMDKKGEQVYLGGVVASVVHRHTKSGVSYTSFVIEDLAGELELTLFAEMQQRFKHLIMAGAPLFLQGKVQERYKRPGMWELRLSHILPLEEARLRYTHSVRLRLPVSSVKEGWVRELEALVQRHSGRSRLELELVDEGGGEQYTLLASQYGVSPTEDLLAALLQLGDGQVEYTLVSNLAGQA